MRLREFVPAAGFVLRMRTYFREMFPLAQRFPAAFLMGYAFVALAAQLDGRSVRFVSAECLRAGFGVFLFLLLLRLMDELKDLDVDRALFPHRPVPSGRVHGSDIRAALVMTSICFLGIFASSRTSFFTGSLVFCYALLMFRWFFIPKLMRPNLPLTLTTHNPVVPLMFLHLTCFDAESNGRPIAELPWTALLLLVALFWSVSFAWEISRKIRAPQDENEYVTYSRLLGMHGAIALTLGAQFIAVGCAFVLVRSWNQSPIVLVLAAVSFVNAGVQSVRFLQAPTKRRTVLRLSAEGMIVAVALGGTLVGWGL